MRRALFAASLAVAIAAAVACSGGSGDGSPTPSPTPVTTPHFQSDIVPLINAQCGSADVSCHERNAYAADSTHACRGWLALEDTALGSVVYAGPTAGQSTDCPDMPLYDRLTQLDAWECGDPGDTSKPLMKYIEPGAPDQSYLYLKISGGPYCGSPSAPMPNGSLLPADKVDLIRRWILAGAPQ